MTIQKHHLFYQSGHGYKRILFELPRNTVVRCHHQVEELWHNNDITKKWIPLSYRWKDTTKSYWGSFQEANSNFKGAAGFPGVMQRGLDTGDAIWQIWSTLVKKCERVCKYCKVIVCYANRHLPQGLSAVVKSWSDSSQCSCKGQVVVLFWFSLGLLTLKVTITVGMVSLHKSSPC